MSPFWRFWADSLLIPAKGGKEGAFLIFLSTILGAFGFCFWTCYSCPSIMWRSLEIPCRSVMVMLLFPLLLFLPFKIQPFRLVYLVGSRSRKNNKRNEWENLPQTHIITFRLVKLCHDQQLCYAQKWHLENQALKHFIPPPDISLPLLQVCNEFPLGQRAMIEWNTSKANEMKIYNFSWRAKDRKEKKKKKKINVLCGEET